MALSLPTRTSDSRVQQCLDFIARQFPIGPGSMQSVIFEKVASLPASGAKGQVVYNEADNKLYAFNGAEWKALY